jgi:hypothetical protein
MRRVGSEDIDRNSQNLLDAAASEDDSNPIQGSVCLTNSFTHADDDVPFISVFFATRNLTWSSSAD